jgi:hypothetical protein
MSRFQLPAVRQIFGFILAILIAFLPAAPAHAAASDSVQITNLEIADIPNVDPEKEPQHLVTLRGTFTNLTNSTIANLDLNLVTSQAITTRSELAEILSNPNNVPDLKVADQSARLRNIPPGVTKSWQVTFRGETVLGDNAAGVFAIGAAPDDPKFGVGSVATTPWFFNADIKPTNVALVVPLTTLNNHLATGGVVSEENDIAEAKRLSALLGSQSGNSISWLMDAGLVQWATQLAKQNDSESVSALITSLSALPIATPIAPLGNTDLSALVRANQQEAVAQALAQTRIQTPDRQIYYSPVSGISDRQTNALLNGLNIHSIVSNESIRGNERDTTAAVVTASSNAVLVYDLAASNCLNNIDINDSGFFTAATCIKSEIGMMTAESPQNSRSVIVLAPKDWKVSSDKLTALISILSNHNWMQLTTLDLVAATPASENYIAAKNTNQRELSRALLRQSRSLQVNTDSVAALYDDPELAAGFAAAQILGFSDLWPSNARANQYLTENLGLLNEYLDAVQLEASTRITTPEESTEIPVTIVNKSDSTVSVSIVLTSNATSRFSAEPTGLVQVEAGQRVTVPVTISLVGAGIVDVQAQLVAPNGENFGGVENIQISSAAYSQFARTLVWGAFGLLILLSLSNVLKRRRGKHSKAAKT